MSLRMLSGYAEMYLYACADSELFRKDQSAVSGSDRSVCRGAPVEYDSLVEKKAQESSEAIRQRVCEVRNLQRMRYGGTKVNARLDSRGDRRILPSGRAGKRSDEAGICCLWITARTYHKVLKVARTIADLTEVRKF